MPIKNHFTTVGIPLFAMIGMGSLVIGKIRELNYSPFVNNSHQNMDHPPLDDDISSMQERLKPMDNYEMK